MAGRIHYPLLTLMIFSFSRHDVLALPTIALKADDISDEKSKLEMQYYIYTMTAFTGRHFAVFWLFDAQL